MGVPIVGVVGTETVAVVLIGRANGRIAIFDRSDGVEGCESCVHNEKE